MRALEGDDIGDQAVLVAELLVLGTGDRGSVVPAERLQGLADKASASLAFKPPWVSACSIKAKASAVKIELGQGAFGEGAQVGVFDQFQAQQ